MIWLQKYFAIVDAEDAAVEDALAGGKQLYGAPASVKRVTERNNVAEFEDRAVGFPYRNIDRVAGVEHCASGGYVYRASFQKRTVVGVAPCELYLVELSGCVISPFIMNSRTSLSLSTVSRLMYSARASKLPRMWARTAR